MSRAISSGMNQDISLGMSWGICYGMSMEMNPRTSLRLSREISSLMKLGI